MIKIYELKQFVLKYLMKDNIINASRCHKRYFVNNNFLKYYNSLIKIEKDKNAQLVRFSEKVNFILENNNVKYNEIKSFIENNLFENGKLVPSRCHRRYFKNLAKMDIYNSIDSVIIDKEVKSIKCAILHIINDKINDEFCECGAVYRYIGNDYVCIDRCEFHNKRIQDKLKQDNLLKYGVENTSSLESTKNKRKSTMKERYGEESFSRTQLFKTKIRKTWDDKTQEQVQEMVDKCKNTIKEKYNVDNHMHIPGVKESIKKTNLERFGFESHFHNKDIQDKIKDSMIEKFNTDNIFKDSEFMKNKFFEKHGVYSNMHLQEIIEKVKESRMRKTYDFYKNSNIYEYYLNFDFNEYYLSDCRIFSFTCKLCNNTFEQFPINGLSSIRCYNCYPKNTSLSEDSVAKYISEITNDKIDRNNRDILNGKELDIYLPDHKLAIEYDGLMFHSFGKSDSSKFNNFIDEDLYKNKHLDKVISCNFLNISLLNIFSNEWNDSLKRDIWKSIICSKLNVNSKIFARKCIIKKVSSNDSNIFLDENHLQGKINSSINIGLYYNNELVCLLNIGKSRYNKEHEYEILRFCNKKYYNVIGGFSKLLKFFGNNYKFTSIITYADKRYSNGNLYIRNNFIELEDSKPNYFYFKSGSEILESRIKYQKHKLVNILENYDKDLTETQNMYNNGYRKIYDCGNKVFVYYK